MISDWMTMMPLLAFALDLTDPQKQALVFVVLGAVIYALVYLRSSPDLVLLGGLTILLVAGVVDPHEALAGFGNEGLITVAVLFVVAEGLRQTGGITVIGQKLLGQPSSVRAAAMRCGSKP